MLKILTAFAAGCVVATGALFVQDFLEDVPPSELASPESTEALKVQMARLQPHLVKFATAEASEQQAILDEHFYEPKIARAREVYPVAESPLDIEGIYTEVFMPAGGLPETNRNRVLINLHGGGFTVGARTEGRLESIPVAAVAGMKVISVDYRQGPEHRFPAASEDVATVYRHLLETYQPEQIGIFGCSAGGLLTAQSVAWFDAHELPLPGAVGIFCAGAGDFFVGDSVQIDKVLKTSLGGGEIAYLEDVDWDDPLVAPINHPDLLSRFPPSLIITSTRDLALSSAVATHQALVAAGTESDLHVYEGLTHYFFSDTDLPESRQVFDVTARFFDAHLAR